MRQNYWHDHIISLLRGPALRRRLNKGQALAGARERPGALFSPVSTEPHSWFDVCHHELVGAAAGAKMRARLPEDQIKHAAARKSGDPLFLDELENIIDRTRRALGGVQRPRKVLTARRQQHKRAMLPRVTERLPFRTRHFSYD
jgi:hypothetical protein